MSRHEISARNPAHKVIVGWVDIIPLRGFSDRETYAHPIPRSTIIESFMLRVLSLLESRVLGVLVEKERTVPDSYPLTRWLRAVIKNRVPGFRQSEAAFLCICSRSPMRSNSFR